MLKTALIVSCPKKNCFGNAVIVGDQNTDKAVTQMRHGFFFLIFNAVAV